jgi:hypothetical protein
MSALRMRVPMMLSVNIMWFSANDWTSGPAAMAAK